MRQLSLLGLVVAVLLGAVTVGVVNDSVRSDRASQDRSLQSAVTAEVTLISNGEHQTQAALSLMLINPAVRSLLSTRPLGPAARRADVADAEEALAAVRAAEPLPLSAVCLDGVRGDQLACAQTGRPITFPPSIGRQFAALARSSSSGSTNSVFVSPLTREPTVAWLSPFRLAGRLLGFAHLDVGLATLRSFVVQNMAGVRVSLATATAGRLLPTGASGGAGANTSGSATAIDFHGRLGSHPLSTLSAGHRAMAAALPVNLVGAGQAAAVAVAREPDPTFIDTVDVGEAIVLALALLVLIGSITGLTLTQRRTAHELSTDALTMLRNRRALMADLPRACRQASAAEPAYLWFFDLNGFKRYNDSFGHLAGDRLLKRLSGRLREAIRGHGVAYRLGGDEFCVIVTAPVADPLELFAQARGALYESGGGFTIDAAAGAVEIPREAGDPDQALRLADQRMYGEKASHRAGAAELVAAVLQAAIAQRHPDLSEHSGDVAADVEVLARSVGLEQDAIELVVKAGDLHDVGKLGIPDELIAKPGPLSSAEWEFMKQHTVMGEEIIAAAGPLLGPIGPLVRASHERWDGMGYPDGLKGEQIPLGARIITICDSFRAMLDDRVYKSSMSVNEALFELRRCSGTQFDPQLVEIFCAIVAERTSRETTHTRALRPGATL